MTSTNNKNVGGARDASVFGMTKSFSFSDENIFFCEEHMNAKNSRHYALCIEDVREKIAVSQKYQMSPGTTVLCAVSSEVNLPSIFVDLGVIVNGEHWRRQFLDDIMFAKALLLCFLN